MMTKRQYRYFAIQELLRIAKKEVKTGCIQFPHFGAHYPDACCIDGYLWDLDSGDSDGLTSGGDDPCPTCHAKSYIKDLLDNEVNIGRIVGHIKFIFSRYGRYERTDN